LRPHVPDRADPGVHPFGVAGLDAWAALMIIPCILDYALLQRYCIIGMLNGALNRLSDSFFGKDQP
jgi:hypothetical protein